MFCVIVLGLKVALPSFFIHCFGDGLNGAATFGQVTLIRMTLNRMHSVECLLQGDN
jgi:hypothetical protein